MDDKTFTIFGIEGLKPPPECRHFVPITVEYVRLPTEPQAFGDGLEFHLSPTLSKNHERVRLEATDLCFYKSNILCSATKEVFFCAGAVAAFWWARHRQKVWVEFHAKFVKSIDDARIMEATNDECLAQAKLWMALCEKVLVAP